MSSGGGRPELAVSEVFALILDRDHQWDLSLGQSLNTVVRGGGDRIHQLYGNKGVLRCNLVF